MPTKNLERS